MPLRLITLFLALLLSGCGEGFLNADDSTDGPTDGGPSGGTATLDGTSAPDGGSNGGSNGDPGSEPTDGATRTAAPAVTATDDRGHVGANGPAMLRGDRSRLVLEIDVQDGASVDRNAIRHLVDVIGRYSGKDVIESGGNTFSSSERNWTIESIDEAVAANRSTASTAETVSIHLLYLRGGLHDDGQETNAIGVAWRASQMAVFPERWSGLGSLLGGDVAVERAVLVHEWGHLLGLVNLTYTSQIDHEDAAHPGHSSSRDSVMFWQVETDLIGQLLGSIPDDFDEADRADMQQIAAGG